MVGSGGADESIQAGAMSPPTAQHHRPSIGGSSFALGALSRGGAREGLLGFNKPFRTSIGYSSSVITSLAFESPFA
jgi:hypothetical protein